MPDKIMKVPRRIFWISAVIMLLISLPVFLGFGFKGEDWQFSGGVIGVEDVNSYIAKMRLGAEGDWLFKTPYTAVEQGGVLLYLPFILLGKFTGGSAQHQQLVVLYHLFRMAAGMFALLMTYRFMAVFISDAKHRTWAWLTAVLGGGLGWLLVLLGQAELMGSYPLDFLSPESFGFLSWYGFPHLAAARGLMLWGLIRFITYEPEDGWFNGEGLKTGGIFLVMTMCQPLTLLVTAAVMAAAIVMRYMVSSFQNKFWAVTSEVRSRFVYGFWSGLMPGLYAAYLLLRFLQDDYLQIWISQNQITALPMVHYMLGFGLLLPLVYFGIRKLQKQMDFRKIFLLTWLGLIPIFILLPLSIQRRLADGAYVVLVIIAFLGLQELGGWWKEKGRALLFALLLPSSLLIWLGGLTAVISPAVPVFIPSDQAAVMLVLNQQAVKGDVVISGSQTANVIPAWAPVTVMNGHGPESANLSYWQNKIDRYYFGEMDELEQKEFLLSSQVKFIWWGPEESADETWHPAEVSYLEWVGSQGVYSLYEVDYQELMGDE